MRAAAMWASVDIRRRWKPLCMLAAFVALAVGSVLALTAGAQRADRALDRHLTAADVPEVLISSQAGPSRDALAALKSDPRIASVERGEGVMMTPAPLEPGIDGFTVIGLGNSLTGGFGRHFCCRVACRSPGRSTRSRSARGLHLGTECASGNGYLSSPPAASLGADLRRSATPPSSASCARPPTQLARGSSERCERHEVGHRRLVDQVRRR